jgi:hypothetical protein
VGWPAAYIDRIVVRTLARVEPVALGRVDANVFDPRSALRTRSGLFGEG